MARGDGALLRRVLAESQLRFDPQVQALEALREDRRGDFRGEQRANSATADLLRDALMEAGPKMTGAYDQALGTVRAQHEALAALPNATIERGQTDAFVRRVGEQQANVAADVEGQRLRATEGAAYADRAARQSYRGDVGKIDQQLVDLAAQAGLFQQTRMGDLKDTRAKNRLTRRSQNITAGNSRRSAQQSERNSIRSSGIDPDTGQPIPGGKLDPKAKDNQKSWRTPGEHGSFQDQVSLGESQARDLKESGYSRAEIAQKLIQGEDSQTIKVGPDGKPLPQPLKVPGVDKVPQLAASVALDLVFDGGVSRGNAKNLRRRRYKVGTLGYRVNRPKPSRPASTSGSAPAAPGLPGSGLRPT